MRIVVLFLAACSTAMANVPLVENSRLGVPGFTQPLNKGIGKANSFHALGISKCLCDERRRSRSTGKERDAETGLDFMEARYFSGAQGRFTSPDAPFADQHPKDPQSWNLYAYGRNNPLAFIDPTGRAVRVCTGGGSNGEKKDCSDYSDDEYQKMVDNGQKINGAMLPGLPNSSNEFALFNLNCGGSQCGTVSWTTDNAGMQHDLDVFAALGGVKSLAALAGAFDRNLLQNGLKELLGNERGSITIDGKLLDGAKAIKSFINGRLQRSASYASELESKSLADVEKLASGPKSVLQQKANQMLKLVKNSTRLNEKVGGK